MALFPNTLRLSSLATMRDPVLANGSHYREKGVMAIASPRVFRPQGSHRFTKSCDYDFESGRGKHQ